MSKEIAVLFLESDGYLRLMRVCFTSKVRIKS